MMDIMTVGLVETHWKECGHFESSKGHLMLNSSNQKESINGVPLIINKNLKDVVES